MIYDSRNDEVCSYSFIQKGLRNVTREDSISNSNVVLNGTCHEFDSCKVWVRITKSLWELNSRPVLKGRTKVKLSKEISDSSFARIAITARLALHLKLSKTRRSASILLQILKITWSRLEGERPPTYVSSIPSQGGRANRTRFISTSSRRRIRFYRHDGLSKWTTIEVFYLQQQSVIFHVKNFHGVSCSRDVASNYFFRWFICISKAWSSTWRNGHGVSWAMTKRQIIISDDVDQGNQWFKAGAQNDA